ncbi:hypothetical protein AB0R12_36170 [Streptomyces niveus]|uniref:hypothetical protein n=1 Tax=Streptomyces niveus TaxID=193462 RepID=UPI003428E3F9
MVSRRRPSCRLERSDAADGDHGIPHLARRARQHHDPVRQLHTRPTALAPPRSAGRRPNALNTLLPRTG